MVRAVNPATTASRPVRGTRTYRWLQIVGWTAYGVLGLAITRAFGALTPMLAVTTLLGAAGAGFATHLLRAWARRSGLFERPAWILVPSLVGAAVLAGLSVEVFVWLLGLFVTRVYTFATSTPRVMFVTSVQWVMIMLFWVALYAGVRFFRDFRRAEIRRLQLEVAARDAQLNALNAQIHPHFLFNALNTMRALVAEDPTRARELITGLSEILRYALQAGRRDRVTLGEELAVIESYLRLEGARYEDRLTWVIEVPDALAETPLPPMLLQTLVENAVRHGIAASPDGGRVRVCGDRSETHVRLRVMNPGHLGEPREGGVGLPNARDRLRLLYGDGASLRIEQQGADVLTEVRLPMAGGA
jgi:signal transduction histidine kinase